MKWAAVTTCIYPIRRRIHYLDDSCRKQGIDIIPFGLGLTYYGWVRTLMEVTLPGIESTNATHILCVDGVDTLIIAPMQEMIEKYKAMGSPPCLLSTEKNMYPSYIQPKGDFGEDIWRFPNGGNFMGEKQYILDMWKNLRPKYPDEVAYQGWIIHEWPIEGLRLDTKCEVFQTMDITDEECSVENGRLHNLVTKTSPCVLHFAGGYCDPQTGRDERMKPWVERLEIL